MKKILYIIMCGLLLLSGCEEDAEPLVYPPTLAGTDVTEMTRIRAVLSGTAVPNPTSIANYDIGFMIALSDNMADAELFTAKAEENNSNQYRATATGLKPGTQYYYCMYAKSGNTLVKSKPQAFKTELSIAPIVGAPTITGKDETSIILSSLVTDDGDDTPTVRGFAYKIYIEGDPDPTKSDNIALGSLVVTRGKEDPFTATAVNLQSNTTYVIRAYATNNIGTGYSQAIILKTDELMTPIVTIGIPGEPTSYTISVTGAVTDERGYPVTEQGFCWSAENRLPIVIENGKNQVAADEATPFNKVVTGLGSKTKYYLRAYATNEKGTGYSAPITFTTAEEQTASLTKMIVTDITISSAVLKAEMATSTGAEVKEKGFCYGKEHNPEKTDHPQPVSGESNQLQSTLTELEEGVTYYARAYATTRDATFYSNEIEFKTAQLSMPEMGNPIFKNITETSATVTAGIVSNGGSEVVERGIYYSTSNQNPEKGGSGVQMALSEGADISRITVNLTGLSGGQRYYIKAFARNDKGIGYSHAPATLITQENTPPKVGSLTVMNIQDDNANAKAFVSDAGGIGLKVTERGFVWSLRNVNTNPTLENCNGKTVAQSTTELFEALLTGLEPNSSYVVRAYAKNDKVTKAGYSQPIDIMTGTTYAPTLDNGRIVSTKFDHITVSAVISNDGGAAVTEVGICWAANGENPSIVGNHAKGTLTGNTFTAAAKELTHNTSYNIAAYAKNKDRNGVTYYRFGSITTSALPPQEGDNPTPDDPIKGNKPIMNGVYTSGRFPNKLIIASSISDEGNSKVTSQGFVWSATDQSPEVGKTGCTPIDIALDEELKAVITGLTPGTVYYIRSFAVNDVGTGYSNTAYITTEVNKPEPGEGDNPLPDVD